jgi:hypothetical protein
MWGRSLQQPRLLGRDAMSREESLAARGPVARVADALGEVFEGSRVLGDQARPVEDLDAVAGLAHLELPPDEPPGRRVAHALDVDEALTVDDAVVELVDLGDVDRERFERAPLGGEELPRAGVQLAPRGGVDLVAPEARPLVEVAPVGELTAGEEVVVDVVEACARPWPSGWRRRSRGRRSGSRGGR